MNRIRQNLLQYITEISFALDDVGLYLDTHPEDKLANDYYQKYKLQRKQAIEDYESNFGPLTHYDVNPSSEWTWTHEPWPWERK